MDSIKHTPQNNFITLWSNIIIGYTHWRKVRIKNVSHLEFISKRDTMLIDNNTNITTICYVLIYISVKSTEIICFDYGTCKYILLTYLIFLSYTLKLF